MGNNALITMVWFLWITGIFPHGILMIMSFYWLFRLLQKCGLA